MAWLRCLHLCPVSKPSWILSVCLCLACLSTPPAGATCSCCLCASHPAPACSQNAAQQHCESRKKTFPRLVHATWRGFRPSSLQPVRRILLSHNHVSACVCHERRKRAGEEREREPCIEGACGVGAQMANPIAPCLQYLLARILTSAVISAQPEGGRACGVCAVFG